MNPIDVEFIGVVKHEGDDVDRAIAQQIEIAKRYWTAEHSAGAVKFVESVGAIAAEHGITEQDVRNIVSAVSTASIKSCGRCGGPIAITSRTDFYSKRGDIRRGWPCDRCRKEEQSRHLAALQRREESSREKQRIRFKRPACIPRESVTFKDAVYLCALFRTTAGEELDLCGSLDSTELNLGPTEAFEFEIIQHLYRRGVIAPAASSTPDAFEWKNSELTGVVYGRRCAWWIAGVENDGALITRIEKGFNAGQWGVETSDAAITLWNELAVEECVQYLAGKLKQHHLPFTPGAKTREVFSAAVQRFSVSQMYNVIWRTAKDCASYYMQRRSQISEFQAANAAVGRIQAFVDRAGVEGWEVKGYERDFDYPRSTMSEVLFDTALGLGDVGFRSAVRRDALGSKTLPGLPELAPPSFSPPIIR